MVSLVVTHTCVLQNGDVRQSFCQAFLPPDKQYVLSPPIRYPNTSKSLYWLLKRTLYGLKRLPRHWFQKTTKLLATGGLHFTPNNTCLFKGKPDGVHDLYS